MGYKRTNAERRKETRQNKLTLSLADVLFLMCPVGFGRVWCIAVNANNGGKERQIERKRKKQRSKAKQINKLLVLVPRREALAV